MWRLAGTTQSLLYGGADNSLHPWGRLGHIGAELYTNYYWLELS